MNIILAEIKSDGSESPEQPFSKNVLRIGRDPFDCDIAFPGDAHPMVSRKHAELRWDNDRWYLVDLNSSYGTFLDGRRISVPEKLRAGQVVQFGTDGPRIKIVWFETFRDSVTPPAPVHAVDPVNPPASPIPPPVAVPVKPAPKPPPKGPGPKIVFVEQPGRPPLELSGQGISIGRDPACDINFDPKAVMVSRKHAVIRSESGRYILEDNDSFNGTFVNDQRISAPTPLYHGDMLRFGIGGPELEFVSPGDQPPVNAGLAGQRSVAADNLAKAFELADPVHSKTMVFKLDQSGSAPPGPPAGNQPQLLMSLTFGGGKELSIGREPKNDITLDGLQISGKHARLLNTAGGVYIDDLGSTNGVYVNGLRVSRQLITPDDRVQIGLFEIRVDAHGNVGVFDTRSQTRIDAVELVREVKVRGGKLRLLDGVSLSIQPNEFVGILGPSGAGKSTLIEALNGMRPASGGNVLINNLDLYRHLDSLKHAIGYVPQDDIIHRELTVYRTLYYVAKLRLSRDISSAEIDQTICEVLDVTGLAERRDVPVSQLSGGQRKRVSIAVELITKPSIIFLDEPTSGLDPATEERIMKLFRQIAESGRTVILTTHAMENVGLFDKIIVLMRGKLVFYGKPADALTHLGAQNYKQLFDMLEAPIENAVRTRGEGVRQQVQQETAEEWRRKFIATPQYAQNISAPLKQLGTLPPSGNVKRRRLGVAGTLSQWLTLSRRYFEVLLKDKFNLFILMAQAPIIGILTLFVMGSERPRDFAYFILAIVSVWFGTSVAAREFVRERPVYRRERMVNLGLIPYLWSKLVVLSIIVGIQCVLLFLPLKFFDLTGLMPMPGEMFGLPQLWTMLLTGGVGIATGLLVSAVVRSSEMATSLVPLILIPQILFSGIVGVPGGASKPAGLFVPAAWSFDTMKRFSTLDTLEPEGASPNGRTRGLGLYKYIESENDKIMADARRDMENYQADVEKKIRDFGDARNAGLSPTMTKPDELPAMPSAKKLPSDLSGYITFLHPWMNEVLNQIVLMLMFGMLVIATLIALRLQDSR